MWGIEMSLCGRLRFGAAMPAAAFSALLGVSAMTGALMLVSPPAFAQSTLSLSQITAIKASLTSAIKAANGDKAAIEAAISQAVLNGLAQYGYDTTASITSAVLTAAEQAGVSDDLIGSGLAQAAVTVETTTSCTPLSPPLQSCADVAALIAKTVANEGRVAEVAAFQSTARALGQTQLASIAGSGSTPTGETGGTGGGAGGGFGAGGVTGGGGGCLNPSCTAL